jgi:hypothetical protein
LMFLSVAAGAFFFAATIVGAITTSCAIVNTCV